MTTILVVPEGYCVTPEGKAYCLGYTQTIRNRHGTVTHRKVSPKELKPWLAANGYLSIRFGRKGTTKHLHRLVAFLHVHNPDPQKLVEVNHINGDRLDNRACNLEWVERTGNMKHASDHGLCGGFYGKQKLVPSTETDRLVLRYLSSVGTNGAAVALDVCPSTIRRYLNRRNI